MSRIIRRVVEYDADEMAARGRIGAFRLHATHDPRLTTAKAREALYRKFENEVDPDGILPDEERARRVKYARKAYMARLALKSVQARRARKATA